MRRWMGACHYDSLHRPICGASRASTTRFGYTDDGDRFRQATDGITGLRDSSASRAG